MYMRAGHKKNVCTLPILYSTQSDHLVLGCRQREWVHSKNLCHLDVKLDNILVFKSDFTKVKLCDFGSVKSQGDIVIKKNELLPYCPPELVAKHANEYYQVCVHYK